MRPLALILVLAIAGLASAQKTVEISVPSGGATLQGTLYLPDGPGPFPAIVGVHGSGPVARDEPLYTMDTELFVPQGIAVFVYDKRGCGKSTGSYDQSKGIEVLVDDALACVRAMRGRPELDPKKIGLKGVSEGGWVVMKAAGRDPDLAFVVALSCPGTDPLEQGLYQKGQILLADGVPQPVVEKINKLRRKIWNYYATGQGYERLNAEYEAARKEPWFTQGKMDPKAPLPDPSQIRDAGYDFFRNARFDAVQDISNIKVPILACFGAKDTLIPVLDSVARWQEALESGHVKDATIRVFDHAGHGMNMIDMEFGPTGPALVPYIRAHGFDLSPVYVKCVKQWVAQHVHQAPAPTDHAVQIGAAGILAITLGMIAIRRFR